MVFIVLTSFYVSTHADIITLKNTSHNVELKVLEVSDEHIAAIISSKAIKTLVKQFSDAKSYPDVVFMNSPGVTIVCKIKEVTEDAVQVLIPASGISSLKTSVQPPVKPEGGFPISRISDKPKDVSGDIKISPQEKAGTERQSILPSEPLSRTGRISDKPKDVLGDIKTSSQEKPGIGNDSRLQTKPFNQAGRISDVPKDVLGDIKTPPREMTGIESDSRLQTKPLNPDNKLGNVEGRVFQNGVPLKSCQVKLVMMEKYGYLTNEYRIVEGALEIESVTDEDGIYYFANVPPGKYKMFWMSPSETGWVRRLKMDPDVVVKSGKLATPKDIETMKRTLN